MPVPAKKKFKHYRGDDFRYAFRLEEYVDPEDHDLGTQPLDLTGWSAEVETDPDVEMTVTDPDATGIITVDMPLEETVTPEGEDDIEAIDFDIQLTDLSGFRRTYLRGSIRLVEQVP